MVPWNTGAGWGQIPDFSGTLEGSNKGIQNLFIDRATRVGLFGFTREATIRNPILDNLSVTGTVTDTYATGPVSGSTNVGGREGCR